VLQCALLLSVFRSIFVNGSSFISCSCQKWCRRFWNTWVVNRVLSVAYLSVCPVLVPNSKTKMHRTTNWCEWEIIFSVENVSGYSHSMAVTSKKLSINVNVWSWLMDRMLALQPAHALGYFECPMHIKQLVHCTVGIGWMTAYMSAQNMWSSLLFTLTLDDFCLITLSA